MGGGEGNNCSFSLNIRYYFDYLPWKVFSRLQVLDPLVGCEINFVVTIIIKKKKQYRKYCRV